MKNWKTWIMVVAFGLIAAAAVVFLVIGITTHAEPTFMDNAIEWAP
jgi:hypothetical protein